mmetsp:Transcript_27434/g.53250  ORF Transcript_27434/g.53250 Transcript_27434/m.53250 type:complete len:251 (+) Transcript_27434:346-1098(+)
MPPARPHIFGAHLRRYRIHPREEPCQERRLGDRKTPHHAAVMLLCAIAMRIERAAGQDAGVPVRPRGILHREGPGEGDPDPRAAVEQPHHHRTTKKQKHKRRHHRHGEIFDAHAKESDESHTQQRADLHETKHVQGRHADMHRPQGDGRGHRPGDCFISRQPMHGISSWFPRGMQQERDLHTRAGSYVHRSPHSTVACDEEDESRNRPGESPECCARARAGYRLGLHLKSHLHRSDGTSHRIRHQRSPCG